MKHKKSKKRFSLASKLLSPRILIILTVVIGIILFLSTYKKDRNKEVTPSNIAPISSKQSLLPTSYPTPIIQPAEKCSVTLNSNSLDTYACTHFSLQLPQGWYGSFDGGQDSLNGKLLSVSEFYNYDYLHAEGRSFDPVKDQGKLKFSIILLISNNELQKFVENYEKQNNWSNFSNIPFTTNNYNAIKVVSTDASGVQKKPIYFIQNPYKTIVLQYNNIFGVDDTFSEKLLSSIKFTN